MRRVVARVGRSGVGVACAAVLCAGAVAGCGSSRSSPPSGTTKPTISVWVSGTASDYRQLAAGVKLALAEAQGQAGQFRINFAGEEVSSDPTQAVTDGLANARSTLQDTQASAMITNAPDDVARQSITLLNEAGISTIALGDAALKAEACSAASDIYPAGHRTAIVVEPSTAPAAWKARFRTTLRFAPDETAWSAYQGTKSLLTSLAAPGVATSDDPPRLDRDTLATTLTTAHGGC